MTTSPRIVYLTAGAGGMFCGSCLNDNTLAKGLMRLGADVQLVPTYTPITTDEEDLSIDQVFFGGINVYLQQKLPLVRWLPAAFDRFLNHPKLIRLATQKDVQADPKLLGDMTVSMLKGSAGFQRKEVRRLLSYLEQTGPNVVNFTNSLIAGCAGEIRERIKTSIVVTLQGDDIFLDFIPERQRQLCIAQIRELDNQVDAYVTHSHYYADYMSDLVGITRNKIRVVPLGIDPSDFQAAPPTKSGQVQNVGYLARLTPEKGFHLMVDAFIKLREHRDNVRLQVAGWLGTEHQEYAQAQFDKLQQAGLDSEYTYHGVVDRQQKLDFLHSLNVFAVPTTYREPKGRFVLEAMACGLPVVLPNHGAFPEMITESGGGILFPPNDAERLSQELASLLDDSEQRRKLGNAGRKSVLSNRNSSMMAKRTLELYTELCR